VALAAGDDGLDAIRRISVEARSVIRKGGSLLIEHGDKQKERLARILSRDGWQNISHVNDLSGKPRVTIAIK
jgi:release factor glutamine methyltransferase